MIKRILFPCPIAASLQTAHKSYFSKQRQSARRVQTIGFASNNIEDIKSLSFKASSPLTFEEGRCLIYRSRFSAARTVKDYLWQGSMLSYFAYCLTFQVNFLVDPMVKHLYVAGIGLCTPRHNPALLFASRRFLRNQSIVHEIYLIEGGKATEIVFKNKGKRRLFGQPLSQTYYNSIFVSPKEEDEVKLLQFPKDVKELSKPTALSYWRKRFSNEENRLLIPTNYQYMNEQILINIFQGKVILS